MAKKKISNLRIVERYDAETDSTKIGFKFASDKTIKKYIKENFDEIDAGKLPDQYRLYYSRVEGGKKRQAQGIKIDNKFISDTFIKANYFDELAIKKGYKNAKEYFANDEKVFKRAVKIYKDPKGWNYEYTSNTIIETIDSFKGSITINGRPVTKKQAILSMAEFDSFLKRNYDSFFNTYTVNYLDGGSKIDLKIPENYDIRNEEDLFSKMEEDGISTFTSGPAETDESDEPKEPKETKGKKQVHSYTFKSLNAKGRKVTHKVTAANKKEALQSFTEKSDNKIISVKRAEKNK